MGALAIIVLKVVNILLWLTVLALWLAIPEELTLNLSASAFSLSLTALLVLRDWAWWSVYLGSRRFQMFVSRSFSAVVLFCILALTNYFAFKNPLHWDVTRQKINSLTEQSRNVVEKLSNPLKATIFSRKGEIYPIKKLLHLYRYEKRDFAMDFVDVELRPDLVKHHDIIKSPTILFEYGDRKKYVQGVTELNITNTLIGLSREKTPLIYYSTGHGEMELNSREGEGGSHLAKLIQRASWKIRPVDLNTISEIPQNISALVVWGPQSGFFEREIELVKRFLEAGGKLMVALPPSFKGDPSAKLRKFLQEWGVTIKNNIVIDQLKHVNGSQGSVPIVNELEGEHPITKELNPPIFFPLTSSVEAEKILAYSSPFPASWADNAPEEFVKGKITYGVDVDVKGPVGYVGVGQKEGKRGAIVAYGKRLVCIQFLCRLSSQCHALSQFSLLVGG